MRARTAHVAREVVLLGGVLLVLIVGTELAQRRQTSGHLQLDAWGYALLVALAGALAFRRRRPRTVFAVVVALIAVYLRVGYAYGPVFLAASVAAFTFAAAVPVSVVVSGVVAAVLLWLVVQLPFGGPDSGWADLIAVTTGLAGCLVVPVWLAAMSAWARDRAAGAAERRRREVGEQRLELAREVHDVVAHNLAVIGLQAGAALKVLDRDPDRARECLSLIVATNRQALSELRGTIDLLRGSTGGPQAGGPEAGREVTPAAGVDEPPVAGGTPDIPALVESARAAGAPVELAVCGDRRPATPAVERAAYRIVQESLTNAMRHAPGTGVTVELAYDGGHLRIRVSDGGPGRDERAEGRGILGMRERAGAVNGTLTLGPGESGEGTVVRADLPLGGRAS